MLKMKSLLLVEDDSIDAMTIKRAVDHTGEIEQIIHCVNGEDGLAYLRDEGNEMPFLIMLDLNMPRMNGLEFLKAKAEDDAIKDIPVVMISTETGADIIDEAKSYGAKGAIKKPFTPDLINETLGALL